MIPVYHLLSRRSSKTVDYATKIFLTRLKKRYIFYEVLPVSTRLLKEVFNQNFYDHKINTLLSQLNLKNTLFIYRFSIIS